MFSINRTKALEAFIEFGEAASDDIFIDFDVSDKDMDIIKNKLIVEKVLKEHGVEEIDLNSNHEKVGHVIYKLKNEEGISLRQIAEILELNRGFVMRMAKRVSK